MPVDTTNNDRVVITHSNSSAEVYYYGATLTSWKPHGQERIFLSEKAILNGSKAIRGGIPLVFPHFGTIPTSKLPQHGFARNSRWEWLGVAVDNASETTVQFGLKPDVVPENLRSLWPHEFKLVYSVTLAANTLKTTLEIQNTGTESWEFTSLLHTYFKVQEIATVGVVGLTGASFLDKVAGGTHQEDRDRVTVASEVDRVYQGGSAPLTIQGTGVGSGVVLHKENFPDVVVWNPWVDKAKAMGDFGDEEYHHMICVEVGSVSKPVTLGPGETWQGSQTLVGV
ncbi:hypothetical protein HK104_001295 [Borealophlyctis nickersoniae]|nr:hypothetical protein HK104_001295 [Borealophlyctis nickersoniae]